jgi:aspartyl aminopeptidase
LLISKKYFSFVLLNQEDNIRALWGLKYTCLSLKECNEEEKDKKVTASLLEIVQEKLQAAYKGKETSDYIH